MAAKKNMSATDIESARDAEIYLRQSAHKFDLDEIHLKIKKTPDFEGDDFGKHTYCVILKKDDTEVDIEHPEGNFEDPDDCYINCIKEAVRKISAVMIVAGA